MFQQHRSQHLVKCATDCCNWHIQSPSDAIRSEMSLNLLSESLIKHLVACTAQMFSKLTNNTFYFLNGILWFYQNKTKKEIKSISVLSGQICKVDCLHIDDRKWTKITMYFGEESRFYCSYVIFISSLSKTFK